ncbi:MAG: hypothetical protein RL213_783 [Bacteroidota bacterium]
MPTAFSTDRIFSISSGSEFDAVALDVFRFQAEHCEVYARFLSLLGIRPEEIDDAAGIPFLPVETFRDTEVIARGMQAEKVFRSSGTTGTLPSCHHVADLSLYDRSLLEGFRRFYGAPGEYVILALLPTYLERPDASLVYMVKQLMNHSGDPDNGFFINEYDALKDTLQRVLDSGKKFILFGVTFALMDLAERFPMSLGSNIVVETGGMKGRRKEIVREELHEFLCGRLGLRQIHSEYGMTELLSQAWSRGNGIYRSVPWMRIDLADLNDPMQPVPAGSTGVIRITDLANLYSCAFIATQDLGRIRADGAFEVLGRVDHSDVRGCNLMVS